MNNELVEVAQIGRTVGLNGDLKLHNRSDFIEQFKAGANFYLKDGRELRVKSFRQGRMLISFIGYESLPSAKSLINSILFSTKEETKKNCTLNEGEYFWFDIIDCEVFEENNKLGFVNSIEHINNTDYLFIETYEELLTQGFSKTFYIPYNDKYIIDVKIEEKIINTRNALEILENS